MLIRFLTLTIFLFFYSVPDALSDGVVVDKVYEPYVLANEREIEWRIMSRREGDRNYLAQRVGYGHALSDRVTTEFYLVGEREQDSNFELKAYEVEVRWMLSEQGELWADWGMLFEVEKSKDKDEWEATLGTLVEKELGRSSLTLNLFATSEWGQEKEQKWESELRLKYRYRWIPQFQPAIEVYARENFIGIGPAMKGLYRYHGQKQLKWEAAFLTEVSKGATDHTFRVGLEYEF